MGARTPLSVAKPTGETSLAAIAVLLLRVAAGDWYMLEGR
jgi:hypothetical protein